jgi:hypothetical protein
MSDEADIPAEAEDIADEFRAALPTYDELSIKLPDGMPRTVGQLAEYYVKTRDVTRSSNDGSAYVVKLLDSIVQNKLTSVSGNQYTWGPYPESKDAADYKLNVWAYPNDGTYCYDFWGRRRFAKAAAFELVISGCLNYSGAALGQPKKKGIGHYFLDFDASRRVNPETAVKQRGQAWFMYDLAAKRVDLYVRSYDERGYPYNADIYSLEGADRSGILSFASWGYSADSTVPNSFRLSSRWLSTGPGRADAQSTKGDVSITECWDEVFRRTYYTDSKNFAPTEGSVGSCR